MDRYDFMSLVDDIFKECITEKDLEIRYLQMKSDLDNLYAQNLNLRSLS
jgi:hypothetical protein